MPIQIANGARPDLASSMEVPVRAPWVTPTAEQRLTPSTTPARPGSPPGGLPARTDRDLALTADRKLAVRQLEGYPLGVARRFGLTHQENVPPATGAYREELLAEIARIDAELDRRIT